ncbi:nucleoporin Nup37-like isoform X2 [Amblyomma americanum]
MFLVLQPVWMRFATASMDNESLLGHKGPVNAAAFEPQSGEIVASVCDNSCRIWRLDRQQQAYIALRSPGTAVLWHPDDHGKPLMAEKWGTLRLYNAMTKPALSIMSLETGQAGLLLSADCHDSPRHISWSGYKIF